MNKVKQLRVSRIAEIWNPWEALNIRKLSHNQAWLRQVEPLTEFRDDLRGKVYHKRRIRYFLECIRSREPLDPIIVDNFMDDRISVDDGNHRLIAHVLTHQEFIQAVYHGSSGMLRRLKSK